MNNKITIGEDLTLSSNIEFRIGGSHCILDNFIKKGSTTPRIFNYAIYIGWSSFNNPSRS